MKHSLTCNFLALRYRYHKKLRKKKTISREACQYGGVCRWSWQQVGLAKHKDHKKDCCSTGPLFAAKKQSSSENMKVVSILYYSQQERKLASYANSGLQVLVLEPPHTSLQWCLSDTYAGHRVTPSPTVTMQNGKNKRSTTMLSHSNASKLCKPPYKSTTHHLLGRVWSKRSNILNIK